MESCIFRILATKNSGAFWTVPELIFESKELIPSLQQLLAGGLNYKPTMSQVQLNTIIRYEPNTRMQ